MNTARESHTATLLPDGTVLVAGGFGGQILSSVELYDPITGTFTGAGSLITERCCHTATLLNDGTVLIAGGFSFGSGDTTSAERYTPSVPTPAPVLFSVSGDGQGQGMILHGATHQTVSPNNPATAGENLDIYSVGLTDGSVIPPQVIIGGRMADVVSFGNAPGWPGVSQINVRVPSGIASDPGVSVRLIYLGRTSNEVRIAIQ
jgi:hypothetical protein